ncbi:MAG TPA: MYXO-CTERM sorting domain-containing protein [Candidatus Thermoplasmatota archaeon]|nr:MYXO-CTERM sorting domain-containing protein [Candidatus Thermoplasmatota archaeon]
MRAAALALVALLLVPAALAHVESYTQSRALQAGPYLIFFDPRPTPPFAEQTVSLVAQFSDANTGTLLRSVPATVIVAGPEDFADRRRMEADGTGYHVASMVLPARGNYSARILIQDDAKGETYSADTEFEVFPDIPYRIRPVDQTADVFTGQRTPLAFEIVDPVSLARKDVADLSVRIEHWTEDHTEFLGAQDATATRVATGVWRIDHAFERVGMYHIRFASVAGGFNYADVPLLHVYATAPFDASANGGNDTPWPALSVLAALALVALLRRR